MATSIPDQICSRHGEKPDNDADPSLTPQGVTRSEQIASALAVCFKVNFLFDSAPSKTSYRPIQNGRSRAATIT